MHSKIKIYPSSTGYDLVAKNYDKKEKYLNSFEQFQVVPLMGDLRGKKILDVGAGTGRLSIELSKKGAEVTALDVSGQMLDVLKKKNNKINIVAAEAESLPFENNTFDFVTAAFLIVHLKDLRAFFDEAYRVLKEGGRLVITNINQKEAPELITDKGKIKIESFYHRPEKVREILEGLAFSIENEVFVKEGDLWINQIIMARK